MSEKSFCFAATSPNIQLRRGQRSSQTYWQRDVVVATAKINLPPHKHTHPFETSPRTWDKLSYPAHPISPIARWTVVR